MQAVCKALDSLVADGKISSKTYNKQTVYVANQVVYIFVPHFSLLFVYTRLLQLFLNCADTVDIPKLHGDKKLKNGYLQE